ncbi:MAG: hypothetical protein WAO52_16955 [Prolixibacteraceae bacterium]
MKRMVFFVLAVLFALASCDGQTKKQKAQNTNVPKTNIKVNKEYDKDGNLIRYDSTYSYFYSNIVNDSILGDSIFSDFKDQFNQRYIFSSEPYFSDFFFQDSLLKYDFYKNDFFSKRYKNDMERMGKLFQEMDSVKNLYFKNQFPERKKNKLIPQ